MTRRSLPSAALFALLFTPAILLAQEISSAEELRLEALARAQAEIYSPRHTVTAGFRLLKSGAQTHFGNLGTVPFGTTQAPLSDGAANRQYDNGYVGFDAPRADETDADGIQTSTPGGRYTVVTSTLTNVTDANGNVIGTVQSDSSANDRLAYTPGLSRVWSYKTPEQAEVRPGYIAMNSYSTSSDGSALDKKTGIVSGVELQYGYLLGRATARFQWSLFTGVSLNDINNKISRDISATLNTVTDFYSLHGQAAPDTSPAAPYTTPVNPTGLLETTVPVSAIPDDHVETSTPGGATVHGRYQVKGGYFLLRLGPSVHTQITERFGLSASIGLAGAYSGTRYTATESIDVPNLSTEASPVLISTLDPETSEARRFVTGYYADLSLEWLANDTTGLFGGFTAQSISAYDQTLGARTARVDIGSSVGLRGGVSIRF